MRNGPQRTQRRLEVKLASFFCEGATLIQESAPKILELKKKENALVSHPVNPPYYVTLIEIVPSPWASPEVIEKTRKLMEEIGQVPVTLSREITDFALNRIQFAVLNETWSLATKGILSVKDVDKVMTEGLSRR
ncbi:hypothetical protein FQA39_LY16674 [Lamprigera yunnana]|nr:hypothetical protein FQA39_LY16674 [Lamprigera yunnana]